MKKGTHPVYRKVRYWRKPTCKRGNKNPNGKIGHTIAEAIRRDYQPYKVKATWLAERYGLSVGNVRKIISGDLWGGPIRRGQFRRITQEQADELRQKHKEGYSYRQLERQFNIGRGSIHHLIHGRTYKHGGLAERSIASVLKTDGPKGSAGSNPAPTEI